MIRSHIFQCANPKGIIGFSPSLDNDAVLRGGVLLLLIHPMDACNDTEKERERCDGNVCNEMERGSFEPINNDNMRNVLGKSHSKPTEPVWDEKQWWMRWLFNWPISWFVVDKSSAPTEHY